MARFVRRQQGTVKTNCRLADVLSSAVRARRGGVHGQHATFWGILLRAVSGCCYNNGGLRNSCCAPPGRRIQPSYVRFRVVPAHPLVDPFRSVSDRSPSDKVSTGRGGKRLSIRTAARWIAEGITKAGLQEAATGTGVKGSASHSRPTGTLNLLGAGAGHLGGHRRSSVNVNGKFPFKVGHRHPCQFRSTIPDLDKHFDIVTILRLFSAHVESLNDSGKVLKQITKLQVPSLHPIHLRKYHCRLRGFGQRPNPGHEETGCLRPTCTCI